MSADVDRAAIRTKALDRYSTIDTIWQNSDLWHWHTRSRIHDFLSARVESINIARGEQILNIGSGGETYGFHPHVQVHVDITDRHLSGKIGVVADAERLPFQPTIFAHAICVGSVVNYCSLMEVISEIERVLTPGGFLVLEYETSDSFEYIGTQAYGRDIAVVETFYQGKQEKLWVYSNSHVKGILSTLGFKINCTKRIHRISSLAYRLGCNDSESTKFAFLDPFAAVIPWVCRHSSNVILFCRKTGKKC